MLRCIIALRSRRQPRAPTRGSIAQCGVAQWTAHADYGLDATPGSRCSPSFRCKYACTKLANLAGSSYLCRTAPHRAIRRTFWLQLSNEETVLRMQRYLRLPLSALAGIVGTLGLDKKQTLIGPLGDELLSGYNAKEDNVYNMLHNALCRQVSVCVSQAQISNKLEGGKVRGTKKRPGDVRLSGDSGSHGWAPAQNREVWSDATCVCPVLPTYVLAAAAKRGAAAAAAATRKRSKYRSDIPGFAFFLPLAFET